jgi:hypothetical protein
VDGRDKPGHDAFRRRSSPPSQTHRTTANAIRANRFTEILEGIGILLLKPENPTMIIGDGQLDFPKLRDRAVLQIYNQGVLPGEAEFFLLFSAITL